MRDDDDDDDRRAKCFCPPPPTNKRRIERSKKTTPIALTEMAKAPRKNTVAVKGTRASKAPGKTILPPSMRAKQKQRFSLVDSSDSSDLSEFESEDEPATTGGQFHAVESDSDDEEQEEHDLLWKTHASQVVNTSSEDDEDDDTSSSDDDDEDYVKLTAERKAKALQRHRSSSPFKEPSPSKPAAHDVDFSFDWNNGSHMLKIENAEEEDVGEELSGVVIPETNEMPIAGEPLGLVDIEDSDSDGDIDRDELLRTLEQESDGVDTGFDTGEDDYNLLQEEAQNIAQDYSNGNFDLSGQTTPRNSVVEDMIRKHKQEALDNAEAIQYVSDDDDDDDDGYGDYDDDYDEEAFTIPYFDDSVFKDKLLYTSEGAMNATQKKQHDVDSEDDSYLWNYFFSGGEGSDDSHDEPMSDDEATDEDTTLPPPSSRKKVGSKAQELLSSSSIIARPPALGTWSTDSKPFGIIDGLSTRSLIPATPKPGAVPHTTAGTGITAAGTNTTPQSNNEEFTLDELLNMSEMEDDENDDHLDHQQWLEVTSSNRKVPLSAFRNKGIVNDDIHLNATRRFSHSASGPKLKSKRLRNEVIMTPVRSKVKAPPSIPEQQKQQQEQQHEQLQNQQLQQPRQQSQNPIRKRRGSKLRRRLSMAEAAGEGLRLTRSGLFSEDTLANVEEFLSGMGNEAELSLLFREIE